MGRRQEVVVRQGEKESGENRVGQTGRVVRMDQPNTDPTGPMLTGLTNSPPITQIRRLQIRTDRSLFVIDATNQGTSHLRFLMEFKSYKNRISMKSKMETTSFSFMKPCF